MGQWPLMRYMDSEIEGALKEDQRSQSSLNGLNTQRPQKQMGIGSQKVV